MIFYITSYPRSGNTWTRRLITNHFERFSVSWHSDQSTKHLPTWLLSTTDNAKDFVFYHSILTPENKTLDPNFIYYSPNP